VLSLQLEMSRTAAAPASSVVNRGRLMSASVLEGCLPDFR
jgi:hypothetical protein